MEIKAETTTSAHAASASGANATAVTNPNPAALAAATAAASSATTTTTTATLSASALMTDASASAAPGEQYLAQMNSAFAKALSLVCPPIQYPPHCRFNPVQQDAADTMEIEARLEELFLHAKQIELLFLNDAAETPSSGVGEPVQQSELEMEIVNLESELNEKHDLIEKYMDVIRGWESKFKRLESRMALERE